MQVDKHGNFFVVSFASRQLKLEILHPTNVILLLANDLLGHPQVPQNPPLMPTVQILYGKTATASTSTNSRPTQH
jgi:hypothetical protein